MGTNTEEYIERISEFCLNAIATSYDLPESAKFFIAVTTSNENGEFLTSTKPYLNTNAGLNQSSLDALPEMEDKKELKKIFLEANKKNLARKVEDIYFFNSLRNDPNNLNYLSKDISEILSYDEKGFTWKPENNDEEYQDLIQDLIHHLSLSKEALNNKEALNDRLKNIKEGKFIWDDLKFILDRKNDGNYYYHNDFDLFYMPQGTSIIKFIPIPILSAISIWLVIPENNNFDFTTIYNETRYRVLSELMDELFSQVQNYIFSNVTSNSSISKFVDDYAKMLSQLLLPTNYKVCKVCKGHVIEDKKDSCNKKQRCEECILIERDIISENDNFLVEKTTHLFLTIPKKILL